MAEDFSKPQHIGDGVYASFDGYQIWLSVIPEVFPQQIALEPSVFEELVKYRDRLVAHVSKVMSGSVP